MQTEFTPRPGAMRFKDKDGEWVCANPGDVMFSTVTMMATEFWDTPRGWVQIFPDGEGSDAD
jgi:hypothetical protein